MDISKELMSVILDRRQNPEEGSYTNYLFGKGREKIAKKLGEEAVEVCIASAKNDKDESICELADLMYHSLVLMADMGISLEDVEKELRNRR